MTDYVKLPDLSTVPTPPAHGSGMRVRFCPSPTGTPHVGVVRTCLFNWAYARPQGGTFVFHIEDTDTARDSEESFSQIIGSLAWLGLDWDEDVDKGGPHGSYRQSERMDIYHEVAGQLLEAGYTCESFSTPEEIQARHVVAGHDPKLGYDGSDRDITTAQREEYIRQGRRPVLRLQMPDEGITFTDLVRGKITFKAGSVPDYVIVRTNGDPFYPLVNPIDDALMGITHILRSEDILSSTPRQIVLYRALYVLGIAKFVPYFGHLPYVMGEGNKELSKRDPESNLLLHHQHGIIPGGLVNYLALLGWSVVPDRGTFSPSEMATTFDIKDVDPNPARFDQKKCDAINAKHIRLLDTDNFMRRLVPLLAETGTVSGDNFEALTAEERRLVAVAAPLAQTHMVQLNQITGLIGFLFSSEVSYNDKAVGKLKDSMPVALSRTVGALEAAATDVWGGTEAIHQVLNEALIDGLGLKPCETFVSLFVTVAGASASIPVFDSMRILGHEETLRRLAGLCVKYCASNGS